MRMWMVDVRGMCQKHLVAEHLECHMFCGTLRKGISVKGYLESGCLETVSLDSRHQELADEMLRRGGRHLTPFAPAISQRELSEWPSVTIDRGKSLDLLISRCPECKERMERLAK